MGGGGECHNCGETGHFSRECPEKGKGKGGKKGKSSFDEPGECFDYRDSKECSWGESCRFTHDGKLGSGGKSSGKGKRSDPGECYDFREKGDCRFGESCRFTHDGKLGKGGKRGGKGPCYDYRDNGDCRFGDDCKFAH